MSTEARVTLSELRFPKDTIGIALIPLEPKPLEPGRLPGHGLPYVEVTVEYDKGGRNIFSGNAVARGYRLRVSELTIEKRTVDGRTYLSKGFTIFGSKSASLFLEGAKMFSAKKLAALAATVTDRPEYAPLVADVIARTGLAKAA